MAKRDDKGDQPTRRTYKSSDVHKRRVGDSSRQKPAKMPSRREARESARESMRITAESRIDRSRRRDQVPDEVPADELQGGVATTASETPGAEQPAGQSSGQLAGQAADQRSGQPADQPSPRFTVIKSLRSSLGAGEPAQAESAAGRAGKPAGNAGQYDDGAAQSAGDAGQPDDGARQPAGDAAQAPERPSRRSVADGPVAFPKPRPATVAIALVAMLVIAAVMLFAFNRWGRYDDHADMQGTWYVMGTEVPIEIAADSIRFNEEVAYQYEIDDREKTISYTFGPMSGQGRYWFSDDRKHLVITDGEGYTAAGTTVDDLIHAFLDLSTATGGGFVELPQGEGIIAFSRTPEQIITNQPAEGLYVDMPDASSSASATAEGTSAGEEAAADPNGEQAQEENTNPEGESADEVISEEAYEQPADEQEAA